MNAELRLLLLSDDAALQESVRAATTGKDGTWLVTTVADAAAFSAAVDRESWHAILADYPSLTAAPEWILALANRQKPAPPVLFLSAGIGVDEAVAAMKLGASDVLPGANLEPLGARLAHARQAALARAEQQRQDEGSLSRASWCDQTLAAVMVWTLEGRIRYWNRGAERLFGWTSSEVVGRNANELWYPAGDTPLPACLREVADRGVWTGELNKATKAGKDIIVHSHWTLQPGDAGEAQSILIINTDITEQKHIEAQHLRSQRLDSVARLAGGIAHDLNNILAPMILSAQMLREEHGNAAHPLLNSLESSAQRAADVIAKIQTFARGVETRKVPMMIRHFLKDMAKRTGDTLPAAITLQTDLPQDLWMVSADASQMYQLLVQLCANAREAMPDGGVLTLSAENVWLDDEFARLNPGAKPGPHVRILVSDTGKGISPGNLEKVFDPFYTTKESSRGAGLGLSTVIGIAKSHHGFVQVMSQEKKGTQFKVYLPALAADSLPPAEAENNAIVPSGHGEVILVVDDEDSIRDLARRALEHRGYQVLTACEGSEAITLYAQNREAIKLVLTDMVMPYMDGATTIRALQRLDPKLKLIAASGIGSNTKITEIEALGVQAFLPKPYSLETLLQTVHRVLQSDVETG